MCYYKTICVLKPRYKILVADIDHSPSSLIFLRRSLPRNLSGLFSQTSSLNRSYKLDVSHIDLLSV